MFFPFLDNLVLETRSDHFSRVVPKKTVPGAPGVLPKASCMFLYISYLLFVGLYCCIHRIPW